MLHSERLDFSNENDVLLCCDDIVMVGVVILRYMMGMVDV